MDISHLLLWGGVISCPLFIIIFLVEGFLRPNYNSLRQPVSALSQGPRGWVQQCNFFSTSILLFAYAGGLYLKLTPLGFWWGPTLMFLYALGLFGAGVFVTDNGTRSNGVHTVPGILHNIFSTMVFVPLTVACFVFAHMFTLFNSPTWAVGSAIVGVLYGVGFLIFARGFSPGSKLAPFAGLIQRLTISIGAIWIAVVALYLLGL